MNEVNNQYEFNEKEDIKPAEYKDKEEIDAYFKDVKKKGFPTKLIFFLLLLLVIGSCAYYYFIIDSPQNVLLTTVKNSLTNIKIGNTDYETINYDYELDINFITNNKEYVDISNIINKFYLTGNIGIDTNKDKAFIKLNTFYEQKELLTLDAYYQNDNYIYLKLNNLYDKVIKTKIDSEDSNNSSAPTEIESETTEKAIRSLTTTVIDTLKNAEFKKEYTKLNENIVKKITFIIDEELTKNLYNNMLNNKEFIENYSKLQNMTEEEMKESLQENIANLEDFTETIYLYVTPLENEFIMLEIIEDDDRTVITKEDDEYNYKIYTDSIIEYQGYISVKEKDNNYEISITSENIEEEISFELNLDLSYEYNIPIDSLDITNAIDSELLTEEDENKIAEKLIQNDAFINVVQDFSSISVPDFTNGIYPQTT